MSFFLSSRAMSDSAPVCCHCPGGPAVPLRYGRWRNRVNWGRPYYACQKDGHGCGFFQWAHDAFDPKYDPPTPAPAPAVVVPAPTSDGAAAANSSMKTSEVQEDARPVPSQTTSFDAESKNQYKLNPLKRGKAIIFSQKVFNNRDGIQDRPGTEKDARDLKSVLNSLGFEVDVYRDKTAKRIKEILNDAAEDEDNNETGSLFVVVMSHGDKGFIEAKDEKYAEEILWAPFMADKCASLVGKPKMFFIQACRGQKKDQGVAADSSAVQHLPSSITIPIHADFLFAHATVPDYVCYRNPSEGSFFIQALCDVLEKDALKDDLLSLLTKVQRVVAEKSTEDGRKQMPSVTTTLTKKVFFTNE